MTLGIPSVWDFGVFIIRILTVERREILFSCFKYSNYFSLLEEIVYGISTLLNNAEEKL